MNNQKEGKYKTRIRNLDLVLSLLVTGSGALFFLCVYRSINGVAYSTWIVPSITVVILIALLAVFSVTVGVKKMIIPITAIAFLPSIIFMPNVIHMVITVVMIFVAIHGLYIMRRTLFNGLKIDMSTVVRSGVVYVSIALVIVVSSQYYFFLKDHNASMIFEVSDKFKVSHIATDFLLSQIPIENMSVDTMTVDDFLYFLVENMYTQEKTESVQIPSEDEGMVVRWAANMGIDLEKITDNAEELAVEQMRGNIASILSRDVLGTEKMSDVFSELIEHQINTTMKQNSFLRENQSEIYGLSVFLLLFSIAPIIRIFSNGLARFIFMILREFKIIHIVTVSRDAEVIEL